MTNSDHQYQLILPSPAKINLFLHINGRRADGYHLLQTVFQFLNIWDTLSFNLNHQGKINLSCNNQSLVNQDNLIIKAAKLLSPHKTKNIGIDIHLDKILPMGGGVGGGSSNAATTLLALNHLWKLNLSPQTLCQIGLQLGADVPVFVNGQSVFAEGIGEIFTPITPPEQWYLLASPNCHISTAQIFTHPDLPRHTSTLLPENYQFENTHNDCESLVKKLSPEVANTINRLLEYAPTRMTGTGACVFSCFKGQKHAENAIKYLPSGVKGTVCKGQNISATHLSLASIFSQQSGS